MAAPKQGGKLLDFEGGECRGSLVIHVRQDGSYYVEDTAGLTHCEAVYVLERVKLAILAGEINGWADQDDEED